MATKIQLRGDTQNNWETINPVLADREIGINTDTRQHKIGNGTDNWSSLPYAGGSEETTETILTKLGVVSPQQITRITYGTSDPVSYDSLRAIRYVISGGDADNSGGDPYQVGTTFVWYSIIAGFDQYRSGNKNLYNDGSNWYLFDPATGSEWVSSGTDIVSSTWTLVGPGSGAPQFSVQIVPTQGEVCINTTDNSIWINKGEGVASDWFKYVAESTVVRVNTRPLNAIANTYVLASEDVSFDTRSIPVNTTFYPDPYIENRYSTVDTLYVLFSPSAGSWQLVDMMGSGYFTGEGNDPSNVSVWTGTGAVDGIPVFEEFLPDPTLGDFAIDLPNAQLWFNAGPTPEQPYWFKIDKIFIGLSEVNNTADSLKPLSSAAISALSGKANIFNPNFGGTFRINSGAQVSQILTATATLDFPSITAGTTSTLTMTVTGAATGDTVIIQRVSGAVTNDVPFVGEVTAANTVSVRAINLSASARDPASGTFRATIIRFA